MKNYEVMYKLLINTMEQLSDEGDNKAATILECMEEYQDLKEKNKYLEDLTDKDADLLSKQLLDIKTLQEENKLIKSDFENCREQFNKLDVEHTVNLLNLKIADEKLEAIKQILKELQVWILQVPEPLWLIPNVSPFISEEAINEWLSKNPLNKEVLKK